MNDYNFFRLFGGTSQGAWSSFDFKDRYEIHVDLPGVKKEDIEVDLAEGKLSVKAKRNQPDVKPIYTEVEYGEISRVGNFRNVMINRDKMEAKLEDGVLIISLPKSKSALPSRIQIK